jgi:hypothetical protein
MNKNLFTVTPSLIGTDFVELVRNTEGSRAVDLKKNRSYMSYRPF